MESSTQPSSTSTGKKLLVRVLILKNVLEYEYFYKFSKRTTFKLQQLKVCRKNINEYVFSVFGMLKSRTIAGDNFLTSIDNTQKLLLYKQIRYPRNYTNRLPLHKVKSFKMC